MDEKYRQYKKSWLYRKKLLMNFLMVCILVVIGYCAFLFYMEFHGGGKVPNQSKNYFYEIDGKEVLLHSSDGLLERYKCSDYCTIYKGNRNDGYFYQGKIMLQDGPAVYLCDLLNSRKLSGEYKAAAFIYDGIGTDIANIKLFVMSDAFGKNGIMNLNGSMQVDVIYEALGKIDAAGNLINYSYSKNYITAKSGGLWGLISLDNGKGLIDFQYEDLEVSPYSKLAVKEGQFWFVVDEGNKRIISKGYEAMRVYEKHLVVAENGQVFALDLLGNVMSNILPLGKHNHVIPYGFKTELEEGKIALYIEKLDNSGNLTYDKYLYDDVALVFVKA